MGDGLLLYATMSNGRLGIGERGGRGWRVKRER